jgi:hypothetical protein
VWNVYILPDWLNIFGSLLYWLSASQYIYDQPHALLTVRRIQLFASCIEVLATIGWCVQWYCEYNADLINIPLSCIGRGFTLDDPGKHRAHHFYMCYTVLRYTLSDSSSLSNTLTLPLTLTPSQTLTLPCLTHFFFLTYFKLVFSLTHPSSHSLPLSLTPFFIHTRSLPHSHTSSHSLSPLLSLSLL